MEVRKDLIWVPAAQLNTVMQKVSISCLVEGTQWNLKSRWGRLGKPSEAGLGQQHSKTLCWLVN